MELLSPTEQGLKNALESARQAKGFTHAALAQKLGIKPPSVTAVLTRKRGLIPQSLLDVLDALDLELIVQPKERQ
ncbi:XRE family transcriptional regulator [Deinococcus sp. MIMF12]|uniref:XRE family transcriptional regulator n=1 Tax=Deinococcus rhizophilus TaxID=3049544 RepID=A0ABT7JF07_9DEIO|nr:XRE family transcriptional regulator [Deinococcus rhizophilus]MDL2342533.1 XRE family transcriptional regulator [Deinococcus rhizophilus]